MIITFDSDKFLLSIQDPTMEGYVRILPLKELILILGENGVGLTILNKQKDFLYSFIDSGVTLVGISTLADIVGYHVALGNECNIKQSIEQNILTFVGYEYIYISKKVLYLYYGDAFHPLPTLITVSSASTQPFLLFTTPLYLSGSSGIAKYIPVSGGSGVPAGNADNFYTSGFNGTVVEVIVEVTTDALDAPLTITLYNLGTLATAVTTGGLELITMTIAKDSIVTGIPLYYKLESNSTTGDVVLHCITMKVKLK